MRSLWLALLVGALIPAIGLSSRVRTAPRGVARPPHYPHLTGTLLVVPLQGPIRVSPDGGRTWRVAHNLPARGSYYGIVADAARPRTAFVTNGDLYMTADAGLTWSRVAPPPGPTDMAGLTVLADDPIADRVYAAGSRVLAYLPGARHWIPWGQAWPTGMRATTLLGVPGQGLYAAAGGHLYHAASSTAPWHDLTVPAWGGSAIDALGVGPDGTRAYATVRGRGVWYVSGTAHQLPGPGLPRDAVITALQSDPLDDDLYVATDQGLFVRHVLDDSVSNSLMTWRRATAPMPGASVVSMSMLQGGQAMVLIRQDGAVSLSQRTRTQTLAGPVLLERLPGAVVPILAALPGSAWHQTRLTPPLASPFTRQCLQSGPTLDQAFAVCGPFRTFYLSYGNSFVLGYPRGQAFAIDRQDVVQVFGKVRLEWRAGRGVVLAPVGRGATGRRIFPRPTIAQVAAANTAYINGYFVDPLFYRFWRRYQYRQSGASIFGPPLSQRVIERSTDGSGRHVIVQYFTNARLEYHPERPTGSKVLLSYLGT